MLKADGTATHTEWNRPRPWKKERDGTITIASEAEAHTITLREDGTGVVKGSRGGSTTLTLIE
ncbi:MAG: hypothetical protein WD342_16645 [Verrucomicrobiales bacterium]